jgi:hypothetical protein
MLQDDCRTGLYHSIPHPSCLFRRRSFSTTKPIVVSVIFSILVAIATTSEEIQLQELLSSVETVLRVALTRFNVSTECLSRMLHVTSTLFRKSQSRPGTAGQTQTNTIAMVVFEILAEGLRREGRVTPSTISSMIEVTQTVPVVEHFTLISDGALFPRPSCPKIMDMCPLL